MEYKNQTFDEERALYGISDSLVENCRFDGPKDGESALKEAHNIKVTGSFMNLRYPFWHLEKAEILNTHMSENCRAALWYDKDIKIDGCKLEGIKAIRECENISLLNSTVNSSEFIWKTKNLFINNVEIKESQYPFFEVEGAKIKNLTMKGKYSFQYGSDIEIVDSNFDTKDAFWHTKNVTVKNTVIRGEYLGWYSENLTLINCSIIGTQPFCYCKNLRLENCTMEGCDLAFERSSIDVSVKGRIESIKNPLSGKITAGEIGDIIIDENVADRSKTVISLL